MVKSYFNCKLVTAKVNKITLSRKKKSALVFISIKYAFFTFFFFFFLRARLIRTDLDNADTMHMACPFVVPGYWPVSTVSCAAQSLLLATVD